MSLRRQIASGLRALLHPVATNRDITDEVDSYLAEAAAAYREQGLSDDQARRAAQLDVGSRVGVRQQIRSVGWETRLESLAIDLRNAWRTLRGAPTLSALAALAIAIGIGVNSAVFLLAHGLLWTDLAVPQPAQLVRYRMVPVAGAPRDADLPRTLTIDFPLTGPLFDALRERQRTSTDLFAWSSGESVTVSSHTRPFTAVTATWASGSTFLVLALSPATGRLLNESDDRVGGSDTGWTANISYRWWQSMFGGASDIAGRTIRVNGFPVTIVGVLPRGFDGLLPGQSADLVLPLAFEGFLHGEHSQRQAPGSAWLLVMGRRRVGVSMAQTAAELDVIRANVVNSAMSRRLQMTDFKSLRLDVTPGRYGWSVHQMEYRRPFIILQALALLLGTIVCANVAGLLLARAAARRHEFQLRSAIGAHAAQLRRHLIAESLLAALAAAPVSAIVAVSIGVTVASVLAEGNFFGAGVQMPIEVGALFIGVTAAGCLLATFAAHFTPGVLLLRSTRIERLRMVHDRATRKASAWLIPAQLALSFVLTAIAVVSALSLYELMATPSGMTRLDTMVSRPDLRNRPERGAARHLLYDQIVESLRQQPGIDAAAMTSVAPMQFERTGATYSVAEGGTSRRDVDLSDSAVSPGYFASLGIPVLQGRDIGPGDRGGAPPVCVVNVAASRFFFDSQPIGKTLVRTREGAPELRCIVVGVVANTRFWTLAQEPPRMVYRASAQANAGERALLVHGRDAATVNAALRRVLEPMMPDQALPEAVAVRTLMSATIVVERVVGWLSAAVALLALALTAASLFGQITWQLDRRLNEFGIRAAIGATPAAIRKLIVSGIGGAVGLGVGVGLLGTWFTATSVSAIAFRASPLDLRVLLATGIVIVGVAMTAVLGPCRRAAAVNPAGVLRND